MMSAHAPSLQQGSPKITLATPRSLPKAANLSGRVVVLDIAFASNLFGIMVGGMLEYLSMLWGYHALLWLVIAFYALAMVWRRTGLRVPTLSS